MKSSKALLPIALAVCALAGWAQTPSGTVKGTVADNSGAVIPATTVTLTGNGAAKTGQTQADGSYTFTGVAPGQYTVSVNLAGFQPFNAPVNVVAGSAVQVPVQLSIRTEKQEVTVEDQAGPAVSVEPDSNATAMVIKGADLEALPDDPDDLSDALQ